MFFRRLVFSFAVALLRHRTDSFFGAEAYLVAVCSSITPTAPHRVSLWLFIDQKTADMGGQPAGEIELTDSASRTWFLDLNNGCDFSSCVSTSGTIGYTTLANSLASCYSLMAADGRAFIDASSKVQCYKHWKATDSKPPFGTWALGTTAATDNDVIASGVSRYCSAIAVHVDGVAPDIFRIRLNGADGALQSKNPTSETSPALAHSQYWIELGVAGGRSACSTGIPTVTNAATSYNNGKTFDSSFCNNVPDGFICPLFCTTGNVRTAPMLCKNGQWPATQVLCSTSSSTCMDPDALAAAQAGFNPLGAYFKYEFTVHPTSAASATDRCYYPTQESSKCAFYCTPDPPTTTSTTRIFGLQIYAVNRWSSGTIQCTAGGWIFSPPAADPTTTACKAMSDASNAVWAQPTNFALFYVISGKFRLTWDEFAAATKDRVQRYEFDVIPPGSLTCPPLLSDQTLTDGYHCYGGTYGAFPGPYQLRVRAQNGAGRGPWSAASALACEAKSAYFGADGYFDPRYDVSGCSTVLNGATCTVTCANGRTTANLGGGLTCAASTSDFGGTFTTVTPLPTCVLGAERPVSVQVTPISSTSLKISWEDAGLRDCSGSANFVEWVVTVTPGGGSGCTGLTDAFECKTTCTLTSLTPNTAYTVTVQASCTNNVASSIASVSGTGNTLPTAAGSPQNLVVTASPTTAGQARVVWAANAAASNCVFESWEVLFRGFTFTWVSKAGCDNLYDVSTTECFAQYFECDKTFAVSVRQVCSNREASSTAAYATLTLATNAWLTCPAVMANPPTSLTLTAQSVSSLSLAWTAGSTSSPYTCVFLRWHVTFERTIDGVTEYISGVPGCTALLSRVTQVCKAEQMKAGYYRFYVMEECTDERLTSQPSQMSSQVHTVRVPATAPYGVNLSDATSSTLKISWFKSTNLNDCTFSRWSVTLIKNPGAGQVVSNPTECNNLVSLCANECIAPSLTSNTPYSARVSAVCSDTTANSPNSADSSAVETLPVNSIVLTGLTGATPTSSTIVLSWTSSGTLQDCTFVAWVVEVKLVTSTTWAIPSGCDSVTSQSTASCTAANLKCGATYIARIRLSCAKAAGDTPYFYITGGEFTMATPVVGGCIDYSAEPPVRLLTSYPSSISIYLSWRQGAAGTCVFSKWEVHQRKDGDTTWGAAKGDCATTNLRGGPSCTASHLMVDSIYWFRVREVCTVTTLNSAWSYTSAPVMLYSSPADSWRTQSEDAVTATTKLPMGTVSAAMPGALYVIFSKEVVAANSKHAAAFFATGCEENQPANAAFSGSDAQIWQDMYTICQATAGNTASQVQREQCCGQGLFCVPTCTLQTAWTSSITITPNNPTTANMACGCTGAACALQKIEAPYSDLILYNNRVLWFTFPSSFTIKPNCMYDIAIPYALLRTGRKTPARFVSAITWSFTYIPSAPALTEMSMIASTTTSFTLQVAWSVAVQAECSIVAGATSSASVDYPGGNPVSFSLLNLNPDIGYYVRCSGNVTGNEWISVSDSRGAFFTSQDINTKLGSLSVSVIRNCPVSGASSPWNLALNPAFDKTVDGAPAPAPTTYSAEVDYSLFYQNCGESVPSPSQNVGYTVTVSAAAESLTTSLTATPTNFQQSFTKVWDGVNVCPAADPALNIDLTATPGAGGVTAQRFYRVAILFVCMSWTVENVVQSNALAWLSPSGTDSVTITASCPASVCGSVTGTDIKVFFGDFLQTQTVGGPTDETINGIAAKRFTFTVSSAKGLGYEIPVILQTGATVATKMTSRFTVSFETPIISSLAFTRQPSGVTATSLSPALASQIDVVGTNLASDTTPTLGARIRVISPGVNQSYVDQPPPLLKLSFDGTSSVANPCSASEDGEYRLVKAYRPMSHVQAPYFRQVCSSDGSAWLANTGVLCWTGQMYEFFKTNPSSPFTPIKCGGKIECNSTTAPSPSPATAGYNSNPLLCNAPELNFVTLSENSAVTPRSLLLTFSSGNGNGIYSILPAGGQLEIADAAQYKASNCDFAKSIWYNDTGVFCWTTTAYSFKTVSSTGGRRLAATEIGAVACSTFNTNPTLCSAPTGDLQTISVSSEHHQSYETVITGTACTAASPADPDGCYCGATTVVTMTSRIQCDIAATVENPLTLQILVHYGKTLLIPAAEVDARVANQVITVQAPKLASVSPATQQLSSSATFTVYGTGFPAMNIVGSSYYQLWAGPEPYKPGKLPPASNDWEALCDTVKVPTTTDTQMDCERGSAWDGGRIRTTRPYLWMQAGMNLLSENALQGSSTSLSVVPPSVTSATVSEAYEVPPLTITINGKFGTLAFGVLKIMFISNHSYAQMYNNNVSDLSSITSECQIGQLGSTQIICNLEDPGTLLGTPLNETNYSAPVETTRYSIGGFIRFASMNSVQIPPNSQLIEAYFNLTATLFGCPTGQYRGNALTRDCLPCPIGRFTAELSAKLSCDPCPLGSYADTPGLPGCKGCGYGRTTFFFGATMQSQCECAQRYYYDAITTPITNECPLCPANAYCAGQMVPPVSLAGYWTPDGRVFWQCYPKTACLQGHAYSINLCHPSRAPTSKQCADCKTDYYRFRSNCFECNQHGVNIAIIGMVGLLAVVVGLLVKTCRQHRAANVLKASLNAAKKKPEHLKGCFERIMSPDKWPKFIRDIASHGRVRMVMVAFDRAQVLWAITRLPFNWGDAMEFQHEVLSIFVFDISVLRLECVLLADDPFAQFWVKFFSPYVVIIFVITVLYFYGSMYQDMNKKDYLYIKGAILHSLSTVCCLSMMTHLADMLWFVHCTSCEINKWCAAEYPLIKCDINDTQWLAMAIASVVDLLLVTLPILTMLFESIFASWYWQFGVGRGVTYKGHLPWIIFFSEFWVEGFKGYNHDLRTEAHHLSHFLKPLKHMNISLERVWDRVCHMVKMSRWVQIEKTVETRIFSLIDHLYQERAVKDAQKIDSEKERDLGRHLYNVAKAREKKDTERNVAKANLKEVWRLIECLEDAKEFIQEVELGREIRNRESLFWTYLYEYLIMLQKFIFVIIAMVCPTDKGLEALAFCMGFQLLVLVLQVDREPYDFNWLNEINIVLDVATIWIMAFALLGYEELQSICAYTVHVTTLIPVILIFIIPPLQEDEEFDDAGNIVFVRHDHGQMVETAAFCEALGLKGLRTFVRAQKRIKKQLAQKKQANPNYVPELNQAQKEQLNEEINILQDIPTTVKEKEAPVMPREYLDKSEVDAKVKSLDDMLKAPIETILQVGWGGVQWPSNFTAAHLAATHGSVDAIDILATAKANFEMKDDWGRTPLDYAQQQGRKLAISAIKSYMVYGTNNSNNDVPANMIGKQLSERSFAQAKPPTIGKGKNRLAPTGKGSNRLQVAGAGSTKSRESNGSTEVGAHSGETMRAQLSTATATEVSAAGGVTPLTTESSSRPRARGRGRRPQSDPSVDALGGIRKASARGRGGKGNRSSADDIVSGNQSGNQVRVRTERRPARGKGRGSAAPPPPAGEAEVQMF